MRAFVHRDDELREQVADVVIGDLTNPRDALDRVVTRMFFSMSVSAHYLEATALDHGQLEILVNMSQMTVSQLTITSTAESREQRQHWLAEHVIARSRLPAVTMRPTVFLEKPLFSSLADASISVSMVDRSDSTVRRITVVDATTGRRYRRRVGMAARSR